MVTGNGCRSKRKAMWLPYCEDIAREPLSQLNIFMSMGLDGKNSKVLVQLFGVIVIMAAGKGS